MNDALQPIAFAVFSWWIGTGLVFIAERAVRGRTQAALSVIAATGMLSLFGVVQSSLTTQSSGAYLGFASSIGLWGALELSFLTGLVTGPRRVPSPRGCGGLRRFGQAIMALLYHELALIAFGVLVAAVCWNQHNPTAACTYTLLWVMRESAKLNLFLGVRNNAVELLPQRLAHLGSYFGKRKVNVLLPVSIVAATIADVALVRHALSVDATPQQNVGALLLATLLALAILEHIVLVLPIRADALWIWATRRNGKSEPPADGRAAARLLAEPEGVPARSVPAVL
jgi:putative photosynthetic complex assembly protein 2